MLSIVISRLWLCAIDDSTINIVLYIIITLLKPGKPLVAQKLQK